MTTASTMELASQPAAVGESTCETLAEAIEHAAHLLPMQGPITSFVHHNTLHAYEHLPFDVAVKTAAKQFGCEPYLAEDEYRHELARGRIRVEDLAAVLREDLGDEADVLVLALGTRQQLRMAMLEHRLLSAPPAELRWFVTQTEALSSFCADAPEGVRELCVEQTRHWAMRYLCSADENGSPKHHARSQDRRRLAGLFHELDQRDGEEWNDAPWEGFTLRALWRICRAGVHGVPRTATTKSAERLRDTLLETTGEDADLLVHELLTPLCAAFADQGLARWPLPDREKGFWHTFRMLYGGSRRPLRPWMRGLRDVLARWQQSHRTPHEAILDSLEHIGVPERHWTPFLTGTLLALRGWAGILRQMELRQDSTMHPAPRGTIVEFLAVRLLLDRLAAKDIVRRRLNFDGPLRELRLPQAQGQAEMEVTSDQRAFPVFQLAQLLGWTPPDLYQLTKNQWTTLVAEIEEFSSLQRRRVFQLAYERNYRIQVLDALAAHIPPRMDHKSAGHFQAVFCIDEREESFRRHLEEVAPAVETFAAAGFFGVAMYYRGAAEAHFVPLCPVVIRPQHWVAEEVLYSFDEQHQRRARARRLIGAAAHRLHVSSRAFLGGALAAVFGVATSVPLVARVLFPRTTAQLWQRLGQFVAPPRNTQLRLERTEEKPSASNGGLGYTLPEMADVVERLLRDIGLTTHFARLVFIVGHGSSSLNNPHEPAHDCGACGGARGGPNARALARMANDLRVRSLLEQRGFSIPPSTHFVGAYHNTCDDSFTCFGLDDLPSSHCEELDRSLEAFQVARERNAHERCRRFDSAPLSLSPAQALRHVEGRAEDLAQTRPEYGHATNAVCIVGRRQRTRGLYMDRRAFLMSYDPTQDTPDSTILARILAAVVPVCAGIGLEYYFSRVDSAGWGCGTKLPHNVTALLGVMDGAMSDLRPGLPWQMVEIHEPVRLLFVIETIPAAMLSIMDRNESIGRLCRNKWVQIATLDPQSNTLHVFDGRHFVRFRPENPHLPRVDSSIDWYRGWRDHLSFATVEERRPSAPQSI